MHRGDAHSTIVGNDKAVWIERINPDIVGVSAPRNFLKNLAPVERTVKTAIGHKYLIVASARNGDSNVVSGASDQRALIIDNLPILATIVGSPDRPLILRLN